MTRRALLPGLLMGLSGGAGAGDEAAPGLFAVDGRAMTPRERANILELERRNLDGVRFMEGLYREEHGAWLALPPWPQGTPGALPRPWYAAREDAWWALGWAPNGWTNRGPADGVHGPVYCSYAVELDRTNFLAVATCDIDGDGVMARIEARPHRGARVVTEGVY